MTETSNSETKVEAKEEWRNMKILCLSAYDVSSLGRVRNTFSGHIHSDKPRLDGYVSFYPFTDGGERKSIKIHNVVAAMFIPNPENKPTIDHIDRNRSNNRVENLRWATYSEQRGNIKKVEATGRTIIQYSLNGQIIREWGKISDASKELKIKDRDICQACKNCKNLGG